MKRIKAQVMLDPSLVKVVEKRFDQEVVLFLYDKYRDDFIKLKTDKFNKVLDDLGDVGKQFLSDELVKQKKEIIEELEKMEIPKDWEDNARSWFEAKDQAIRAVKKK